jgi:hypothetical protein
VGASVHLAVTMWCATGEREGRSGHISYNCTRILVSPKWFVFGVAGGTQGLTHG